MRSLLINVLGFAYKKIVDFAFAEVPFIFTRACPE